MAEITHDAVDALARKLESLELTGDEQAALAGLIEAAESADGVVAFTFASRKPGHLASAELRARLANILLERPKVVINHEEQYIGETEKN